MARGELSADTLRLKPHHSISTSNALGTFSGKVFLGAVYDAEAATANQCVRAVYNLNVSKSQSGEQASVFLPAGVLKIKLTRCAANRDE
jgi:hypothetical protein